MSDDTGAAWQAFCRDLEKVGDVVLNAQTTPLERAEGFRYLTRLLRVALEMNLEWADPDFPGFYQASHFTAKIGADNPDNHYLNATVSSSRRYLIRGKRGTVPILTFGSKANRYATDGTMVSTGELAVEDMQIAPDGTFEVIVSKEKPKSGVNWLPMQNDTSIVIVRQTFFDRANETANTMSIETLDGPDHPAPLTPEFLIAGLKRSAGFVNGTAQTFVRWAELFRAEQKNKLETTDQAMFYKAGGDPGIYYLHGYWELAPGEALEIVSTIPKCQAWNFQLNNYWMESLDYRSHTIHVNPHTAKFNEKGEVTIVVAARDPGYGNWVDTAGHDHGTMLWRWTNAEAHPIPRCRVIKLSA